MIDEIDNWADNGKNFFDEDPSISVYGIEFTIGTRFQVSEGGYQKCRFEVIRVWPSSNSITAMDLNEALALSQGRTLFTFHVKALEFHIDRDALEHPNIGW